MRSQPLPELRTATADDLDSLLDVFYGAMDDLLRHRGREPLPRNPVLLGSLLRYLVDDDPPAAFIAEDYGQAVGFGVAHRRGIYGFLSFLFVLPESQRRGIGRALLRACRVALGEPPAMATCAEADQPVATGIYASLGMAPQTPLYLLTGDIDPGTLPTLPDGLEASGFATDEAAALDQATLGYERPRDHERLRAEQHDGWALRRADAELVAYGYVHRSGRLGPVAAADAGLLTALLGYLGRSIQPAGAWQIIVPGRASTVLPSLLELGMRIEGTPAVYCADHAGPSFERYLPMSFALL